MNDCRLYWTNFSSVYWSSSETPTQDLGSELKVSLTFLKNYQSCISTETLKFTNRTKVPFTSNTTVWDQMPPLSVTLVNFRNKGRGKSQRQNLPQVYKQCPDKEEDFTNRPGVQNSRLFQRTQTPKVKKVIVYVVPEFAFHPLFLLLFLIFCFLTGNSWKVHTRQGT